MAKPNDFQGLEQYVHELNGGRTMGERAHNKVSYTWCDYQQMPAIPFIE
ncbi:hypothetical protein P4C99_07865 [Pontiellaceae bacterium B1224]|nr:hypothetical protein [Pontiellaceae bacterium B1224]